MAWTYDIDRNIPPDTGRSPRLGAQDIRNFKEAICERLGDWIYGMLADDSETDETKYGVKKLPLNEQSSDPSSASNRGFLYTKDVSGVTELFYEDSDGNVKQLTTGGKLNVGATEAVLLTGDQTIAGVKTFSSTPIFSAGAKTDTISEKTSGNGITIDGCLIKDGKAADSDKLDGKDYNSTDIKPFGSWESKSFGTVYQAPTDGFAIGYAHYYPDEVVLTGYTDSSNPPTTIRSKFSAEAADGDAYGTILLPVKKGNYWKIVVNKGTADALYWIPLGV